MKFTVMLMVVAVTIAAMSTFTTSEEDMEDGPLSIRSESNVGPSVRPSCSSLTKHRINYKVFFKLNPLVALWATTPAFNCTQVIYIGPADKDDDYSGTVILLQAGTYLALDATYTNEINSTWCGSGANIHYPIIYAKFDKKNSAYCAAQCADNGVDYVASLCVGRTAKDKTATKDFLDATFGNTLAFQDMQLGCPQPQHCYTFNY